MDLRIRNRKYRISETVTEFDIKDCTNFEQMRGRYKTRSYKFSSYRADTAHTSHDNIHN